MPAMPACWPATTTCSDRRLPGECRMEHFYTEAQIAVRDMVRRFAETRILGEPRDRPRGPTSPARPLSRAWPSSVCSGSAVPEAAGGGGLAARSRPALTMEELARCSAERRQRYCALPVEAAHFLYEHGDATLKPVPGIRRGRRIPATGRHRAAHGTDVAAIRTTRCATATTTSSTAPRRGSPSARSSTSSWSSPTTVARSGQRNISCFIVEGDRAGLRPRHARSGSSACTAWQDCEVIFENVRVPARNRLGPENRAFKMAMGNFNFSRLMMASMALGMAQRGFEDALRYAQAAQAVRQRDLRVPGRSSSCWPTCRWTSTAARLLIDHAVAPARRGTADRQGGRARQAVHHRHGDEHVTNALQIHGGARLLEGLPHRAHVPRHQARRRSTKAPTRSSG